MRFRCTSPRGFEGSHRFEILPWGEAHGVLSHALEMQASGAALLTWPLVFRWLHDALLKDALTQASLRLRPEVRPWSSWVKLPRWAFRGGKAPRQQVPALPLD